MGTTKKVTAHSTAVTVSSTVKHKKTQLTSINIDNQHTAELTIRIQDIFTPDASHGTTSPVETTKERFQVTVPAGITFCAESESLQDVCCLGDVKAIADAISTSCVIIVGKHLV